MGCSSSKSSENNHKSGDQSSTAEHRPSIAKRQDTPHPNAFKKGHQPEAVRRASETKDIHRRVSETKAVYERKPSSQRIDGERKISSTNIIKGTLIKDDHNRPPTPHPEHRDRAGSDLLDPAEIRTELDENNSSGRSGKAAQSKLQVLFATYDGTVVTSQVQEYAKNRSSLHIKGGVTMIPGILTAVTAPANQAPKMFSMTYTFVTTPHHKLCGISDGIEIEAPQGYHLRIPSATYGGKDCTAEVKRLVVDTTKLSITPGTIPHALVLPDDGRGSTTHVFDVCYVFHTDEFELTCTESEDIDIAHFKHTENEATVLVTHSGGNVVGGRSHDV